MAKYQSSNFLLDEGLRSIAYCPVCNSRFNPLEARVLDEKEDAHLVYIKCRHCQASVLAVVLASSFGISSIGLVTDLSGDDVLKFRETDNVSIDEVIKTHQNLFNDKKISEELNQL